MIVYKFGGALARSKRGLSALVTLLREAVRSETARARRAKKSGALHGVVLVTSAIGHTTRYLSRAAELAEDGKLREAEEQLERIVGQHRQLAISLELANERKLFERFETIAGEIAALFEGVAIVRELSPRTRDAILASGERLATALVHALLEDDGFTVRAIPALSVIITSDEFGHAVPIAEEVTRRAEKQIIPALKRGALVLVEGFMGATLDGVVTTMGNESSDLTATLLAGALGAKEVVIWKTLPGLYTADPEFVKSPKLIRAMSFEEAEELGRRGARMLFPAFAHPISTSDTVVRIATPFSHRATHTALTREAIGTQRPNKPLSLALENHLVLFSVASTTGGFETVRERAIYHWSSDDALYAVVRRDDRRAFMRELEERSLLGSEEASIAAVSLVLRNRIPAMPDLNELFRSLRAFHTHAVLPIGRSVVALVAEEEAVHVLRKLHHDLFEM